MCKRGNKEYPFFYEIAKPSRAPIPEFLIVILSFLYALKLFSKEKSILRVRKKVYESLMESDIPFYWNDNYMRDGIKRALKVLNLSNPGGIEFKVEEFS